MLSGLLIPFVLALSSLSASANPDLFHTVVKEGPIPRDQYPAVFAALDKEPGNPPEN